MFRLCQDCVVFDLPSLQNQLFAAVRQDGGSTWGNTCFAGFVAFVSALRLHFVAGLKFGPSRNYHVEAILKCPNPKFSNSKTLRVFGD